MVRFLSQYPLLFLDAVAVSACIMGFLTAPLRISQGSCRAVDSKWPVTISWLEAPLIISSMWCCCRDASTCAARRGRHAAADKHVRNRLTFGVLRGFTRLTIRAYAIAGGYLFALLEEEHSEQLAAEITSALLAESEVEILHMLRERDALDSQVAVEVLVHRVHTS